MFAVGPFDAQAGDEISSQVQADSTITLAIMDSVTTSGLLDYFVKASSYSDLAATCFVLRYEISRSGMNEYTNSGAAFTRTWKSNTTGSYYFVFVNLESAPVHVDFNAIKTSYTYSILTRSMTVMTTATLTHIDVANRYVYLVLDNIVSLAAIFLAVFVIAIIIRRKRSRARHRIR